jgi:hypothetical protein
VAAAVLAAAVVVCALVRRDRRLRREVVSQRLMAGCAHRDNAALVAQVEAFERRLGSLLGAGDGDLDEVAGFESVLPQEGGPTW